MSLMNDALRKKNREITASPVAQGFTDVSQRPRISRRWFVVLTAMTLLTATALAGIHLMQSAPGKTMLVKSPLPEHSRPPVSRAANASSEIERPAATTAAQSSPGGMQETKDPGGMPDAARPANGHLSPAPASPEVYSNAPAPRASQNAPAMHPANEKPVTQAVSRASTSIEAPVEPSPRITGAASRAFEPGPDQTVQRQPPPSAASMKTRTPAQLAPSPPPGAPTKAIGERKAGAAVRKATPSDRDGGMFYTKALAYHRSGHLADAIRLYRQVLKSNSSHPGAMLNLAAATMQQGNYLDAHPLLKRLEQSTPRPEGVLLNLAIAAIGMGAPEKALDYLDQAKALSDASPWEIRFHRGVAFARMNRLPEALALYREAEAERPDDPRLQFNLALTCDALGLYPEAVAHYEAVLRGPSESSEADKATISQRIRTIRRYLDTAQSPATGQ